MTQENIEFGHGRLLFVEMIYWSLCNTGLHNKMKVHEIPSCYTKHGLAIF